MAAPLPERVPRLADGRATGDATEFRVIRLTESSRHNPLPPWFGQIIADGPEPF